MDSQNSSTNKIGAMSKRETPFKFEEYLNTKTPVHSIATNNNLFALSNIKLIIFDLESKTVLKSYTGKSPIYHLNFFNSFSKIFFQEESLLYVWDYFSGDISKTKSEQESINCIIIAPDDQTIASSDNLGTICKYSFENNTLATKKKFYKRGFIISMTFWRKDVLLASSVGTYDSLFIIDYDEMELIKEENFDTSIFSIIKLDSSRIAMGCGDSSIRIFDFDGYDMIETQRIVRKDQKIIISNLLFFQDHYFSLMGWGKLRSKVMITSEDGDFDFLNPDNSTFLKIISGESYVFFSTQNGKVFRSKKKTKIQHITSFPDIRFSFL